MTKNYRVIVLAMTAGVIAWGINIGVVGISCDITQQKRGDEDVTAG